jgi:hypothetical protein
MPDGQHTPEMQLDAHSIKRLLAVAGDYTPLLNPGVLPRSLRVNIFQVQYAVTARMSALHHGYPQGILG